MKKNVIVTGGSGFIGSNLVRILLKKKYNVLNLDKLSYASIKNLKFKTKKYSFKKCDISQFKKTEKIINNFKPNYIINCAAESHVDRSIKNPSDFMKSNILGTFNILETLKKIKWKCRLLHVSTDEVFGSLKKTKKFNEETRYDPKSPYSASKASSDHLVRAYGNTYNIDYVITNCSNNYGPFQHPEKFIPTVILSCLKKKKIPIYGNGKNIREWIFVSDHCNGIVNVLENGKSNNTYLIGSKNEFSNLEIATKICKILENKFNFNYSSLISFVKDRKGHDFRYAINYKKISRDLKFKNSYDFNNGLKKTIEFYVNNLNNLNKLYS